MPGSSAASLALAARLRALDDDALGRLIRERGLTPASLRDVFDVAEALLDPAAIDRALARLPRTTLAAIATVDGSSAEALRPALDALLADLDGDELLVPPAVTQVLAAWPARGLPDAAALTAAAPPPALALVDDAEQRLLDRAAAERAFGTATAAGELLRVLAAEPARLLSRGGVGLPETKRLAAAVGCALDDVPALMALAVAAGLAGAEGGAVRVTRPGRGAVELGPAERWEALARGWRASLPSPLTALLAERVAGGGPLGTAALLDWLYPAADDALREQLRQHGAQAERLGLLIDDRPSVLGRTLLGTGPDDARAALEPLLPPEVDRVYLQHDLTVVSPGPLAATVDVRLRRLAEVESTGLAARYRITAESVARAIAGGETAESLLAFLAGCSLTGVPQPLAYLIEQTARRHGAVRVEGLDDSTALALGVRTRVRSDDPVLLEAITVDRATAPLGLRRLDDGTLGSRLAPEVVLANLVDARYPAAAAGSVEGTPTALTGADAATEEAAGREAGADAAPAPAPSDSALAAAVARIRASMLADGDDAGVARQWQLALRGKVLLRATVRLPDGSERVFELEPTGVGAGRVRGRDRVADVERTLPVSSITAVEPIA